MSWDAITPNFDTNGSTSAGSNSNQALGEFDRFKVDTTNREIKLSPTSPKVEMRLERTQFGFKWTMKDPNKKTFGDSLKECLSKISDWFAAKWDNAASCCSAAYSSLVARLDEHVEQYALPDHAASRRSTSDDASNCLTMREHRLLRKMDEEIASDVADLHMLQEFTKRLNHQGEEPSRR